MRQLDEHAKRFQAPERGFSFDQHNASSKVKSINQHHKIFACGKTFLSVYSSYIHCIQCRCAAALGTKCELNSLFHQNCIYTASTTGPSRNCSSIFSSRDPSPEFWLVSCEFSCIRVSKACIGLTLVRQGSMTELGSRQLAERDRSSRKEEASRLWGFEGGELWAASEKRISSLSIVTQY